MITPLYVIGQTVYRGRVNTRSQPLECPDCFGTEKWTVNTPAGEEIEVPCHRCGGHVRDLPPLKETVFHPYVETLTIGSVRTDTYSDRPVSYMCRETGVGSGSIHYEDDLHSDKDAAMKQAEVEAAQEQAGVEAKPEVQWARALSQLTLGEAVKVGMRRGVWDSWYRYRELMDLIADSGDDELKATAERDAHYRPHPVDAHLAIQDRDELRVLLDSVATGEDA